MLGHVADDERVAQVRLVRPIFQHRFPVSDAREGIWRQGLALAELLKYAMKHRLDSIEDVILRDEAHFEIKLVEFARRTIGTGVFVTKARRDLEIAIEARNHKEIGRASGRERVCQYVKISVDAVSLQKNNNTIPIRHKQRK